ncbi:MAG TPA: flagellar biosynthesis regulatory protein FlaF [Rhodobacteraceae bacterium]|nr:flagellar biosynthesis regulatory protein FlaF [Paracoccaceae bacterium]
MNALHMAQTAYGTARKPIRTAKSAEYDAFAHATSRLNKAARLGRSGFVNLAAALHDNRRLWSALANDVADERNELPPSLRARIFYLAEFTHQHSSKVLRGEETVDALIEINTAIMRGLRGSAVTP